MQISVSIASSNPRNPTVLKRTLVEGVPLYFWSFTNVCLWIPVFTIFASYTVHTNSPTVYCEINSIASMIGSTRVNPSELWEHPSSQHTPHQHSALPIADWRLACGQPLLPSTAATNHAQGALHCMLRVHYTVCWGCTALYAEGALHCMLRVHCTVCRGCTALYAEGALHCFLQSTAMAGKCKMNHCTVHFNTLICCDILHTSKNRCLVRWKLCWFVNLFSPFPLFLYVNLLGHRGSTTN